MGLRKKPSFSPVATPAEIWNRYLQNRREKCYRLSENLLLYRRFTRLEQWRLLVRFNEHDCYLNFNDLKVDTFLVILDLMYKAEVCSYVFLSKLKRTCLCVSWQNYSTKCMCTKWHSCLCVRLPSMSVSPPTFLSRISERKFPLAGYILHLLYT